MSTTARRCRPQNPRAASAQRLMARGLKFSVRSGERRSSGLEWPTSSGYLSTGVDDDVWRDAVGCHHRKRWRGRDYQRRKQRDGRADVAIVMAEAMVVRFGGISAGPGPHRPLPGCWRLSRSPRREYARKTTQVGSPAPPAPASFRTAISCEPIPCRSPTKRPNRAA